MKKILCIFFLLLALVCFFVSCDEKETEKTCADGNHTAGEWIEFSATCTEGARVQKNCTVCGVLLDIQVKGSPLGHRLGGWKEVAATCTVGTQKVNACSVCGEVMEREILGQPLGHSPVWQIVKEATTETTGLKASICIRCKKTLQTLEIPVKPLKPGDVPITPGYDENGRELDDLDQYNLDYSGEIITLLYWKEVERPEFEQKELASDNVLNAIYDRNINVEDRLGVELEFVPMYAAYGEGVMDEFLRKIDAVRLAKTHDYDIIATYARTEASLAIRGHLQNFAKIEESYINLDKPWWPRSLVDTVTFGNDSHYFISGDMSTNVLWMMHCIFVNMDMLADLKLEDPYTLVREGDWTIDKMIAMTENLWVDLDNNNKPSVEDQIGFCAVSYVCDSFYPGCNMRYIEEDDTMMLKVSSDYTSAKAVTLINKLGDWASGNAIWLTNGNSAQEMQDNTTKIFPKGKTLMWMEHACYAESSLAFGKVRFSYAMIPTPKYDTAQKNYYTGMGNPWSLYGIFVDCDSRGDKQTTLSMLTAVLECYASEAYRLTTPEIFEILLGQKYGADKSATEVFELIRSGVTFDLGKIFGANTGNLPEQASNAIVDHTSWSSKYKAFLPNAEEQLAKIVADFRQEQASQ